MLGLYPLIQPNQVYHLAVEYPHNLYIEETGNPDGIPVLFLHGGPGGGCIPAHRSFFDPAKYRIILFDQRGAGRSTPHAELAGNDTWRLLEDIEQIRRHLGIERWLLFGGSWGSTLALVYAINHPGRVMGLVLRGIFLGRQEDIDWLYHPGGGARQLFPDFYQEFLQPLGGEPADGEVVARYHELLTSPDELRRLAAAKAWSVWEGRISTLRASPSAEVHYGEPHLALAMARIECHYFVNHCFLDEGYILQHLNKVQQLPAVIVHGRYDTVCKLENAWSLVQNWSQARLNIIPDAGHSAAEPGIVDALRRANDAFALILEES